MPAWREQSTRHGAGVRKPSRFDQIDGVRANRGNRRLRDEASTGSPSPFNSHHPDAALTRRRAPALICHAPASLECNQVYVHRIGACPSEA